MANKPAKTRMCITCRASKPQSEMIRVVRAPDGTVRLDKTGRADGRGAYICREKTCIEKAQMQKRTERALSCSIPAEIYEQLGETYA